MENFSFQKATFAGPVVSTDKAILQPIGKTFPYNGHNTSSVHTQHITDSASCQSLFIC